MKNLDSIPAVVIHHLADAVLLPEADNVSPQCQYIIEIWPVFDGLNLKNSLSWNMINQEFGFGERKYGDMEIQPIGKWKFTFLQYWIGSYTYKKTFFALVFGLLVKVVGSSAVDQGLIPGTWQLRQRKWSSKVDEIFLNLDTALLGAKLSYDKLQKNMDNVQTT